MYRCLYNFTAIDEVTQPVQNQLSLHTIVDTEFLWGNCMHLDHHKQHREQLGSTSEIVKAKFGKHKLSPYTPGSMDS